MIQSYTSFADVNECTTGVNNCDANAVCNNTEGWFECTCKPGYSGNGFDCTGDYILVKTWIVLMLTLGRTQQIHTPTVVQGGQEMEPLPGAFDMLQYFQTILPLVESL